jgi:hypothetical protein
MIVGVQGHEAPDGIEWAGKLEPPKMNREDARKLFCDFSGDPAHASDHRLDGLIADVDYIPHTVKLLAGAARGFPDIEQLQSLWYEKRIAMFPGPDGHSRGKSAGRLRFRDPLP